MHPITALQHATVAARVRTNDATISTRAQNGRIQIGRVTYKGNIGEFSPVTEWLPIAHAVAALNNLGA